MQSATLGAPYIPPLEVQAEPGRPHPLHRHIIGFPQDDLRRFAAEIMWEKSGYRYGEYPYARHAWKHSRRFNPE